MRPLLILLLTSGIALSKEPEKKVKPTVTLIEQDVIEAVLACGIANTSEQHIVEDMTSVQGLVRGDTLDEFVKSLRDEAKGRDAAFQDALEDFIKKAAETKLVFPRPLPKNTELVTPGVIQKIFSAGFDKKPDGWQLFYKRFPQAGGLITISRPGIDAKQTVAIIYLGRQSHYVMGAGQLYILKFNGKKWILQNDFFGPSWIS